MRGKAGLPNSSSQFKGPSILFIVIRDEQALDLGGGDTLTFADNQMSIKT
jgi:hypothetical protein